MKRPNIIVATVVVLSLCSLYADDRVVFRGEWPETKQMVAGRLVIQDRGMEQGAHVLSAIVELNNRSGHAVDMEFDPHDLRIEVFNSDGVRIDEDAGVVRSGPVPMSHRMTISAGAYAGLPTHRGGIGLPIGRTMLAAGWQVWTLPPAKYTAKGTAKITAGFGAAALDPLLPNRGFKANEDDFPPVGETKSIAVELQAVSFQVNAINSEDDATAARAEGNQRQDAEFHGGKTFDEWITQAKQGRTLEDREDAPTGSRAGMLQILKRLERNASR